MRSFWMRSIITASTSSRASSTSVVKATLYCSSPMGSIVAGPATRTFAPRSERQRRFERATRLWAMSPTIAIVFPVSPSVGVRPKRSRSV